MCTPVQGRVGGPQGRSTTARRLAAAGGRASARSRRRVARDGTGRGHGPEELRAELPRAACSPSGPQPPWAWGATPESSLAAEGAVSWSLSLVFRWTLPERPTVRSQKSSKGNVRRPGRVALRQLLGTFDPPCPVAAAPSVGLR